jgi:hypothetical protein
MSNKPSKYCKPERFESCCQMCLTPWRAYDEVTQSAPRPRVSHSIRHNRARRAQADWMPERVHAEQQKELLRQLNKRPGKTPQSPTPKPKPASTPQPTADPDADEEGGEGAKSQPTATKSAEEVKMGTLQQPDAIDQPLMLRYGCVRLLARGRGGDGGGRGVSHQLWVKPVALACLLLLCGLCVNCWPCAPRVSRGTPLAPSRFHDHDTDRD